jgi:K+-sensing histidine kinase KdpD
VEIGRSDNSHTGSTLRSAPSIPDESGERRQTKRLRYLWATLGCIAISIGTLPLARYFDTANIVPVFILGRGVGRGQIRSWARRALGRVERLRLRFLLRSAALFLCRGRCPISAHVLHHVGGRVDRGQLTAGLRFQARVASHREQRAGSLYEIARDLSGAMQIDQVVKISSESIERTFHASAVLLLARGEVAPAVGARTAIPRRSISILGLRNGLSTRDCPPDSAPTPCRAVRFCTYRCAHPRTRAVCWRSRQETVGCCASPSSASCSTRSPR